MLALARALVTMFVFATVSGVLGTAPGKGGEILYGLAAPSEALGRDLPYALYLPDAHDPESTAYPVIFLLHGYGADHTEWDKRGGLSLSLDRLIASGRVPPLMAVMPYAEKSWYVDSAAWGGPGDFETAIVDDLARHVEAAHGARGDREGRAIAGLSMGGHGALRLAFAHPDRYVAVAGLSPAIWKPGGVSWAQGPLGESEEERERWYPRTTGETFDLAVFNRQSPFALVPALAATEPRPRIMLASGDDDYFALQDGTVELYLDLRAHGMEPELRIDDGAHDWTYWRAILPEMLTFLARDWTG